MKIIYTYRDHEFSLFMDSPTSIRVSDEDGHYAHLTWNNEMGWKYPIFQHQDGSAINYLNALQRTCDFLFSVMEKRGRKPTNKREETKEQIRKLLETL